MGSSYRLGSILGFEIRVHASWFILFALILWTFTFAVFPTAFPGLGRMTYIGMGLIGTFLFFASLVAHELAHSVVARRLGVPVEGITLFLLGGIAHTTMEAKSAGDEFKIAGVGPLASLVIGLGFGLIWMIGIAVGWPLAIIGVALYLGFLNIVLAVFNLLPGFPLDGGRLFRSAVWKYTGDLTRATRAASAAGRWLGILLIGLGVIQALTTNVIGGVWLVLIGWFLRGAAARSYEQHQAQEVLTKLRASDAMTRDPETVSPDLTLRELVDDHFTRRRYHAFPVAENGHPLGIITLGQVKGVAEIDWPSRTIRETMAPVDETIVVRGDDSMAGVVNKMERGDVQQVLVLRDGGELEGIITTTDVSGWLQRVRELEGRG